jgi:glycosyltransferase involved in cell wall biosynthesis
VGGLPENVTDGRDGWVVPPASVDSIVEALSKILENREVLGVMGAEARSTALREFSLTTFVGNTERVYRESRAQPA